ncbi:MAG: UDP-N-acetylmuramoyl-L-alanine--D-glutamate ligase [Smithellaceae bacterium]
MELSGQKVLVIGMGATGVAAASFLGAKGALVRAVDEKAPSLWGEGFAKLALQPWMSVQPEHAEALAGIDLVVPSPGIPPQHAMLVAAQKKGIPILSEIELAYRFIQVPIIAVTGTNGKTTTTTLLGEILSGAGKKIFVGGNIGTPLIAYAGSAQEDDFVVAEISSFQLQWIETFRPRAAVLLNITCDHVNYHGSFDEYRRIKARIFENQQSTDLAILNNDDDLQKGLAPTLKASVEYFSSQASLKTGIFIDGREIVYARSGGRAERYPLNMIRLPGLHNAENVMAAIIAARFCGVVPESIVDTVSDFRGLAHRIEFAGEKNAVKFYDDSKGTNVDAVVRALKTFAGPVILLLGGRDKDGDFETLRPLLHGKVRSLVLFGEARDRIESLIGDAAPMVKEATLREAVARAYLLALPGDVVLLSPGCASFDEFANYKERGNTFKKVVGTL